MKIPDNLTDLGIKVFKRCWIEGAECHESVECESGYENGSFEDSAFWCGWRGRRRIVRNREDVLCYEKDRI